MQQRGRPAAGPHTPPVQKFAESLVKYPKIEKFFAHKYWPEQKLPALYMPHCRDFTFRRGDCVDSLKASVRLCAGLVALRAFLGTARRPGRRYAL